MYTILFIIFLVIVVLFLLIHKPTSQLVDKIIVHYFVKPPFIEQELQNRANAEGINYFKNKDASGIEIVHAGIKDDIINVDRMARYSAYIELELLKRKISSFRRFLMTEKEHYRLKYLHLIFRDGPFTVGIVQPTQDIIDNIIANEKKRSAEEIEEMWNKASLYIPIPGHFIPVGIILFLIMILIVFAIIKKNKPNNINTNNTNNTDNDDDDDDSSTL
jgi:hypothetical protein